jgi:hypothetical protein
LGRDDCNSAEPGDKCGVGQLVMAPLAAGVVASPGPSRESRGGSGRLQNKCEMKDILYPRVRELVMLSALAALGCGLAAVQGDLFFVAIFAGASVVTIIEAIRRLR